MPCPRPKTALVFNLPKTGHGYDYFFSSSWSTPETSQIIYEDLFIFIFGERLNFEKMFDRFARRSFVFGKHFRMCPWSLILATSFPVFGLERVFPWKVGPWPRIFFASLASSLVFSTPPLVIIGAKGYCQNIWYNDGFVRNRNFNNCAALLSENLINSSKVEARNRKRCKFWLKFHKYLFQAFKFWRPFTTNLIKLVEDYEFWKRCISDLTINKRVVAQMLSM